ncbi:MAG: PBP1A family penicillin-binding protein [Clostridiales bacterium]|jgi:penicillin-binding protein 1A|nr:PBP1A family penicillin-binding protein [Clostridiales bacterium]
MANDQKDQAESIKEPGGAEKAAEKSTEKVAEKAAEKSVKRAFTEYLNQTRAGRSHSGGATADRPFTFTHAAFDEELHDAVNDTEFEPADDAFEAISPALDPVAGGFEPVGAAVGGFEPVSGGGADPVGGFEPVGASGADSAGGPVGLHAGADVDIHTDTHVGTHDFTHIDTRADADFAARTGTQAITHTNTHIGTHADEGGADDIGGGGSSDYADDPDSADDPDYSGSLDSADDPDYSGSSDSADDPDYADGESLPRRRALPVRILLFLINAVKWVLIYMGRFVSTVLKTVLIIVLVIGFGVLGAGLGAIYGYIEDVAPITNDMLEMKIQTSYIYDADGNELARLTGSGNVNRELVRYDDMAPLLPRALIAIEDERFESHNGIDPKRIVGAALGFITSGGDTYGGSTITQQLIKNVTDNTAETLERKVKEWYLAVELEKTMEKWKILELYLNFVYFGNGCYGVSAASKTYLGKDVGSLSLGECAFLVSITNSPGRYNPFSETGVKNANDRKKLVLGKMLDLGMISNAEYEGALAEKIKIIPKAATASAVTKPQSYFVDRVITEVRNDLIAQKGMTEDMAKAQISNYGLRIYTTQSPAVQAALDAVFNDPEYFPQVNADAIKNNEQPQGAMVILDPTTAQIKAMSGGYGEKMASLTFNRATQARRQPGSSIKPIAVYGPALDQHMITPATVVDDIPMHLDPNDTERVYPKNSSNDFRGLTTIRTAIRRSVNVVAAKTWLQIPDTSHSYLDKVGINRDSETQVALALGGLHRGVTPLEMAGAYVPFVNRGMYYEPTTYTKVLDSNGKVLLDKTSRLPTIVYSEQTAFLMTSMLQDVVKSGTGTAAALFDGEMPAAGKTGTTNDNADRWFVGYTPYYVASTWYGYDNRIKQIVLESQELGNAMRIWKTVMEKIHEGLEPKELSMPDQIVSASVCAYSGKAPTALCRSDPRGNAVRTEYFIKGTEPRESDPCDVHTSVSVCETGSAAVGRAVALGPYCPAGDADTRVVIRRVVPFAPKPGDPYPTDWGYEYAPLPVCPYHTADGISPDYLPEGGLPDGEGTGGEGAPDGAGDVIDSAEIVGPADDGGIGEPSGTGEAGGASGAENSGRADGPRRGETTTQPRRTPRPAQAADSAGAQGGGELTDAPAG